MTQRTTSYHPEPDPIAIARDSDRIAVLTALQKGRFRLPSSVPNSFVDSQLLSDLLELRPFRELTSLVVGDNRHVADELNGSNLCNMVRHPRRAMSADDPLLPWEALERYGELATRIDKVYERRQLRDSILLSLQFDATTETSPEEMYMRLISVFDLHRAVAGRAADHEHAADWLGLIQETELLLYHHTLQCFCRSTDYRAQRPDAVPMALLKVADSWTQHGAIIGDFINKCDRQPMLAVEVVERAADLLQAVSHSQESITHSLIFPSDVRWGTSELTKEIFLESMASLKDANLWHAPFEEVAKEIARSPRAGLILSGEGFQDLSLEGEIYRISVQTGHGQIAHRSSQLLQSLYVNAVAKEPSLTPFQVQSKINQFLGGEIERRWLLGDLGIVERSLSEEMSHALARIDSIQEFNQSRGAMHRVLFDTDLMQEASERGVRFSPTQGISVRVARGMEAIEASQLQAFCGRGQPFLIDAMVLPDVDEAPGEIDDDSIRDGFYAALAQMMAQSTHVGPWFGILLKDLRAKIQESATCGGWKQNVEEILSMLYLPVWGGQDGVLLVRADEGDIGASGNSTSPILRVV